MSRTRSPRWRRSWSGGTNIIVRRQIDSATGPKSGMSLPLSVSGYPGTTRCGRRGGALVVCSGLEKLNSAACRNRSQITNRVILFNSEHLIHFQEEKRGYLTGNGQVPCSTRSLAPQYRIACVFLCETRFAFCCYTFHARKANRPPTGSCERRRPYTIRALTDRVHRGPSDTR